MNLSAQPVQPVAKNHPIGRLPLPPHQSQYSHGFAGEVFVLLVMLNFRLPRRILCLGRDWCTCCRGDRNFGGYAAYCFFAYKKNLQRTKKF